MKNKKICFASSCGGHFEQLMMLKPLMDEYEHCVVTEKTKYLSYKGKAKIYYLKQMNRKEGLALLKLVINTFLSIRILFKEKPDVVITTGVLAVLPLCLIAKLMGKKLIYIESFAKVNSANVSGKVMYRFADQFYVQWESMLKIYPKAIYMGSIY